MDYIHWGNIPDPLRTRIIHHWVVDDFPADMEAMKFLPDDTTILQYLQGLNLRILSGGGYQYFREHLDDLPGNYLEIGVFEGVMLRELATLFPHKKFYGIDPFIEDGNTSGHNGGYPKGEVTVNQMNLAHENLDNLPNVKLFEQTSRSFFAERTHHDLHTMDVTSVFVDGDHSYPEARNDIFNSIRLLKDGGVILVDDAGLPDVKRAIFEVASTYHDKMMYCPVQGGLALLGYNLL